MVRLLFLVGVCFFVGITCCEAQSNSQKDYYVMIGVFTKLDEAELLTDEANLKGFNAQFAMHSTKKQYYVYLLQTSDKKKAKSFLDQIRKETDYKNAWLYSGKLGKDQ